MLPVPAEAGTRSGTARKSQRADDGLLARNDDHGALSPPGATDSTVATERAGLAVEREVQAEDRAHTRTVRQHHRTVHALLERAAAVAVQEGLQAILADEVATLAPRRPLSRIKTVEEHRVSPTTATALDGVRALDGVFVIAPLEGLEEIELRAVGAIVDVGDRHDRLMDEVRLIPRAIRLGVEANEIELPGHFAGFAQRDGLDP